MRVDLFLVLCVPVAVAAAAAMACSITSSDETTIPRTPMSTGATVDPSKAKTVISAFGASEFFSIADAEAKAGFHIPVPSADYPMGFGRTYLQAALDGTGTFSSTQYTYPPLDPSSVGVNAGPASVSVLGIDQVQRGKAMTIGGRDGWLARNDSTAIEFAFLYGETADASLWCIVRGPAEMGFDAFQQFVESLH